MTIHFSESLHTNIVIVNFNNSRFYMNFDSQRNYLYKATVNLI